LASPGELRRKLVALALRGGDGHREAARENPRDQPFEAADVIDIGDHTLADAAGGGRDQGEPARRHVDDLAREFPAILEHVAAEEIDLYALVPAIFAGQRRRSRICVEQCHAPDRPLKLLGPRETYAQ
jgi:hypothetical protein